MGFFFSLHAVGNNHMHHGAQFTLSPLMSEFANKIRFGERVRIH